MDENKLKELRRAAVSHNRDHGQSKTRAILEKLAGVTTVDQVPDGKADAVLAALRLGGSTHLNQASIMKAYNTPKGRARG